MKRILLLGLSILLTGCSTLQVDAGATKLDYVSGRVKNVIDGYIADADVYVGETKVATTNKQGSFVAALGDATTVRISKVGYEDTIIDVNTLKTSEVGDVSLDYTYSYCGETKFKSVSLYNDWTGYNTRTLDSIKFKFVSPYTRFSGTQSELSLYVDTKDVTSSLDAGDFMFKLRGDGKMFVYDYGFVYNEIYTSIFDYQIKEVGTTTEVTLEVPYEFLQINETDIVGVIFNDYIASKDLMCDYVFDGSLVTPSETKRYTRLNKKGLAFGNYVNDYNELWMSKAAKERLTEPYHIVLPKGLNANSDEIYFSYDYKEQSLDLSFTGFGYYQPDEYIKMVIHTDGTYNNLWNISKNDTMLHIYRDRVLIFYGATSFFAPENNKYSPSMAGGVTYRDHTNYFTLDLSIDWELVTGWTDKTQGIKIALTEFGNDNIYQPLSYDAYIYVDGTRSGDIAAYNGYLSVNSPFDVISITEEERKALTAGYDISFANPNDTLIEEADDMYVKAQFDATNLTLDFVGFGNLQTYETIKFVLHNSNDEDKSSWAINSKDASVIFNKEKAVIKLNATDFFSLNLIISSGTTCRNAPIYTEYENYFTFKLILPLDQLGSIASATSVEAIFIEMDYCGNVYNGGDFQCAMRYKGIATGDPAMQKNYAKLY